MLKNLPAQDLIAFHAFLYVVNMKSKEQFFISGTCNREVRTFTALLSIDAQGNIFENQDTKGEVSFTLTFSFEKHRATFVNSKNSSSESRLEYSILTQITPQLYTQSLLFTAPQLLIKEGCRTKILNRVKHKSIDVFSLYREIMMPLVVNGNVVTLH